MSAEQRPLLMMPHVYAIRDWSELFETAESRKRAAPLEWVRMPTQRDGRGYMRVMGQRNRQTVYLGWCLLAQEAGKMPCRGVFAHLGGPLDATDLAEKTRLRDPNVFRVALNELAKPEIGWIEQLEWRADLGFWENIERLGLTPAYIERQKADAERKRRMRADTGGQKPAESPREQRDTGTEQHATSRNGTTQADTGGRGVQDSTTSSRGENSDTSSLSTADEADEADLLPLAEQRDRLVALTKKNFAGAELSDSDFRNPEKNRCLQAAQPITRAGFDALEWFYGLPLNHEVFRTTARVQSAEQLLRKLKNEIGKALTIRAQVGEPATALQKEPEPDGWRALYEREYPGADLPASFWQLTRNRRDELPALRAKYEDASK